MHNKNRTGLGKSDEPSFATRNGFRNTYRILRVYLEAIKDLQEKNTEINRKSLAKKVNRSEKTALRVLNLMKKKGIISIEKRGIGGSHTNLSVYKLTKTELGKAEVTSRPSQHGVVNALKVE